MATTNTVKQTDKKPLAKACGVSIAPARVASMLGKYGLNAVTQKMVDDVKAKKEELKKRGAPAVPPAPGKGQPKLTEDEKNARAEARKRYNEWKSPDYLKAENLFNDWKQLRKTQTELDRELKKAEKLASYEGDDAEKQKQAVSARKTLDRQRKELENITNRMENLANQEYIKLFIDYDIMSKSRIRINREATVAVASVIQEFIEESALYTMERAYEEDKKIIMPLHTLGPHHDKIPLYPLISNLKAYKLLCQHAQDIVEWEQECKKFDVRVKNEAKKRNIKIKEHKANKKNQRPKRPELVEYVPENAHGVNFTYYINKIVDDLRDNDSEKFGDLRVSSNLKTYYSSLALDFCNRLVPWILTMIECKNIKTVGAEIVMKVVKLMLIDGGCGYFTNDIQATVQERIDKLRRHNAGKKDSTDAEADANEVDEEDTDEAEAEDEDEAEPEVEDKTATTRKRRQRVAS